MSGFTRQITVAGRKVSIAELGRGTPLLYLHGLADVHSVGAAWMPFHEALAQGSRVIAPAHPGCADSEESEDIENIDDLAFHYIETIDALRQDRIDVVGTCIGGWIAAELAVRYPERIGRLVLIGASGLHLPDEPIGDVFWESQPENGTDFSGLRRLLFADPDGEEALAAFPDQPGAELELARYKMMRFASRYGFNPPYFYNRKLRTRLYRYGEPTLLLWGASDRLVSLAHAEAYEAGFGDAELKVLADSGHSPHLERPRDSAAAVRGFLDATPRSQSQSHAHSQPAARPHAGQHQHRGHPAKSRQPARQGQKPGPERQPNTNDPARHNAQRPEKSRSRRRRSRRRSGGSGGSGGGGSGGPPQPSEG